MNSKTLFLLSAVTLGFGALAIYVTTSSRPETTAQAKAGSLLFEDLRAHVNDVRRIRVTSATESYTLQRSGEAWGLTEKGGYPVSLDKVKELVVGLSELELVEEKTANPELYSRLEVQDPSGDSEATSKRVELFDSHDKLVADLVVGREIQARGGGAPHLYVRRPEAGPALEVEGRVRVEASASALLDREIAKLERKRVRRVTITHPDGQRLVVERDSPDVADFSVADLPEGAELSWPGIAGGVAGALEYLNLEDVRAADSPFDGAAAVSARFESFDGLVVVAQTLEDEGELLLRVRAEFDADLRAPAAVGPPAPPDSDGEPAAPAEPVGASPEEVRAEVDAINARVADWIYVVPGYAGSNLRKLQQDLLAKPAESPEESLPVLQDATPEPGEPGDEPAPASDEPASQPPAAATGAEPAEQPAGGVQEDA